MAAAAAFFCNTFFLLASNCEKKKNGLGTWERERETDSEKGERKSNKEMRGERKVIK